jgi:hypothetical protein
MSNSDIEVAAYLLEGLIVIASMVMTAAHKLIEFKPIADSSALIWFGQVATYILYGLIASFFSGIPMKFGYGGWYIYQPKKQKK